MVLEGLLNIAKGGMNMQVRSFERAAQTIAKVSAHPADRADHKISEALLESQTALRAFKANAAVYETGLDIWDMLRLSNPDRD